MLENRKLDVRCNLSFYLMLIRNHCCKTLSKEASSSVLLQRRRKPLPKKDFSHPVTLLFWRRAGDEASLNL